MGEVRNTYKISAGKLKGRNHFGDLGLDRRIIPEISLRETGYEDTMLYPKVS
jgi:hypothetical protein